MVLFTLNSFEQEPTATSSNTSIPQNNNHHFRDSSSETSDSDEFSTTPSSPITPMSPNNDTLINNTTPNMQRRASESITEAIQFKKLPVRRYTLPSRINPFGLIGNTSTKFWGAGRDSSVQVAMDNVQFGL